MCVCTDYFQENVSNSDEANRKIDIALIGKNQLTIPIVQNLSPHLYNVTLYYRKDLGDKRNLSDHITVVEIANYEEQLLERLGLFNQDIVVCSANDDSLNRDVAKLAKAHDVKRVICRLENSNEDEEMKGEGIEVFSISLVIKSSYKA